MTRLLEIGQICTSFGSTLALRSASLSLGTREIHVPVGQSGVGKSTLMKILASVHQCDDGRVLPDGVEVDPQTCDGARSLGIGTGFQGQSPCNNLSVAEYLSANRKMAEPNPVASGGWGRYDVSQNGFEQILNEPYEGDLEHGHSQNS